MGRKSNDHKLGVHLGARDWALSLRACSIDRVVDLRDLRAVKRD